MALPQELLRKSSSIRGFFLNNYLQLWKLHLARLTQLVTEGKLQSVVDPKEFKGLGEVAAAIDHMYKGGNVGKVVVKIGEGQVKSKL